MKHILMVAATAIVLAGCGLTASDLRGTSTAKVTPALTETPTPKRLEPKPIAPTETPTATAAKESRFTLDYSSSESLQASLDKIAEENLPYWTTGIWPSEQVQAELTSIFFTPLYTQILTDAGWQKADIEKLNLNQLCYEAYNIIMQHGATVAAAPSVTKQMELGSQALAYTDKQRKVQEGFNATFREITTDDPLFMVMYNQMFSRSFDSKIFSVSSK